MKRLVPVSILAHALLGTALASPAGALQTVHVVTSTGAGAVQAAVDAAVDGDLVLVHAGTYGPVTIAGKGVSIVADPPNSVTFTSLTITGLPAGGLCSVSGVAANGFELPERSAIRVSSCAGAVRFAAVQGVPAFGTAAGGMRVVDAQDVVLTACTLTGSTQQPPLVLNPDPAGFGLYCATSKVAVFDSTITGGAGRNSVIAFNAFFTGGAGGGGVLVNDPVSEFFASGTTITGGPGGSGANGQCIGGVPSGPSSGFPGGVGITANTSTRLRSCTITGGNGGGGGACAFCPPLPPPPPGCGAPAGASGFAIVGSPSLLSAPAARLLAPAVVREGTTLSITVLGAPGGSATIVVSGGTRWLFYAPFSGTLHYADASRRLAVGTIPGSGALTIALPIAPLASGQELLQKHLQGLVRAPDGSVSVGTSSVLTILDSSF